MKKNKEKKSSIIEFLFLTGGMSVIMFVMVFSSKVANELWNPKWTEWIANNRAWGDFISMASVLISILMVVVLMIFLYHSNLSKKIDLVANISKKNFDVIKAVVEAIEKDVVDNTVDKNEKSVDK